jgi:membrane-associated phospholipid phosphatase
LKSFLKNNFPVLTLYLALVSVALYYAGTYGKVAVHSYINNYVGNPFWDTFFFYMTYLGDGLVLPFLFLGILFYNLRTGIYATISFFTATIITSILKYKFYDDVDRPSHVFDWTIHKPLHYVEGTDLHIHNSFPSGHSTQVFAIFMCLIFTSTKQSYKILFFLLALISGFSRVYLSQHWLIDITAGSLIGTGSSLIYYYVFIGRDRFTRINKPLLKLKKNVANT